jgi:hypothetical protein
MIKTTITSKGNAQDRIGKETFSHLSAFIPSHRDTPTEAATSVERPA